MPLTAATLSDPPKSRAIMKPTAVTSTTVNNLTISTNTATSDPQDRRGPAGS